MDEHPEFQDGDIVEVDTSYFGVPDSEAEYIEGMVVGRHELGFKQISWIVEFGKNFLPGFEYRTIILPSFAIVKPDLEEEVEGWEDDE